MPELKQPNPLVAFIILNWNRANDTLECLASLQKLDCYPAVTIVVDNASSDDSVLKIEQNYPDVQLVRNKKNLGFAQGNNIGIKYALDHGASFVLLLNNDTIVDGHFLAELISVADQQPRAGIFGPKILSYAQPDRIWFAGPKRKWAFGRFLELGHRGFGEIDRGQYDNNQEVEFASGCALFLRRELIEKIGFLDEDFFAYFEDADYCRRAIEAGYKIFYVPLAKIWHKGASSSMDARSYSAATTYLGVRNRLLFMRKHGSRLGWFIFLPEFCLILARTWISFALSGHSGVARPILRGILDFLKGKLGNGSVGLFSK